MSVKIRLKRLGKVRVPQYRIVVVDSRKKRDGKVIEEIGTYQPKDDPSIITVVSDRAQYWLGVGAQPSEAVAKLLRVSGDWQKFKGISGTEGTLRLAEPKRSKIDIFNEALKEAHGGDSAADAVTAKKAPAKKAAAKKAEPAVEPAVEPAAEAAAAVPVAPVPVDETPAGATADAEAAADKVDGAAPEAGDAKGAETDGAETESADS